jgi:UDP-galactopyranose mutase
MSATPPHASSFPLTGKDDFLLICFSHLRWDFVFQRPQHLMKRFATCGQVLFWEEPVLLDAATEASLDVRTCEGSVVVATPRLPASFKVEEQQAALKRLLDTHLAKVQRPLVRWYYTPMMLPFSQHVRAECVVYDCMDELANFRNAPPELIPLESRLLEQANLVFTGGYALFEAKRTRHPNIHPFPSSVDVPHFLAAREEGPDPADHHAIASPRLGFYGVIDERMDLALLERLADSRPDWSIIIVGPVVKISESDLPRRPNIHYLGSKSYCELPDYLRGWDVALMPFVINDSTRFISPTKTPEYLAAGCPVVSTPIADVIRHYGDIEAVSIAASPEEFVTACEAALALPRPGGPWRDEADALLSQLSWDRTFGQMRDLILPAMDMAQHVQPIVSPTRWPATERQHYDVMVVGAGFAGAVMAERLAAGSGKKVLVVDRRPHIAGNAYDRLDDAGVLIHQYGPHIFHTNSQEIADYLSRFTAWRPYEHRVLADVDGVRVPMPINRTTLNLLYGLDLQDEEQAAAFLRSRAEPVETVRTSADVVISAVGRELYETFFPGLHTQAMGDGSVPARQVGDRARPYPNQYG